jgi:3-hydroxy-9,10-secoandrosta-1,3,5(10)-triene-9,17-dione monooxygenase
MSTTVQIRPVPVPEPQLTPDEMIERARALQPRLREEQDATEARGHFSPELDQEFRKAGFYRCLQPRLFGGYEFDLKTFYRIAIELARGDPSTA